MGRPLDTARARDAVDDAIRKAVSTALRNGPRPKRGQRRQRIAAELGIPLHHLNAFASPAISRTPRSDGSEAPKKKMRLTLDLVAALCDLVGSDAILREGMNARQRRIWDMGLAADLMDRASRRRGRAA